MALSVFQRVSGSLDRMLPAHEAKDLAKGGGAGRTPRGERKCGHRRHPGRHGIALLRRAGLCAHAALPPAERSGRRSATASRTTRAKAAATTALESRTCATASACGWAAHPSPARASRPGRRSRHRLRCGDGRQARANDDGPWTEQDRGRSGGQRRHDARMRKRGGRGAGDGRPDRPDPQHRACRGGPSGSKPSSSRDRTASTTPTPSSNGQGRDPLP